MKNILELVVGDLSSKREYSQMMKRVKKLPNEYSYAFKRIQHYMYCVGSPNGDASIFTNSNVILELLNLFEESSSQKTKLLDVVGQDVALFADEYMLAFSSNNSKPNNKEKLNREIAEYFATEVYND